ncbi:MAG: DUF4234 domain-containing protein [Deltaproteobacteria bacterium]|nr:MAG: DUF4234 domain-containing protein [Deltaproteobacteria bacterium]
MNFRLSVLPVAFGPRSHYFEGTQKINPSMWNERMEDLGRAMPSSAEQQGFYKASDAFADVESDHTNQEVASSRGHSYSWNPPLRQPKVRNKLVCFLLYVVTFSLYQIVWLYLVHKELPRRNNDMTGNQVLAHLLLYPLGGVIGLFIVSVLFVTALEEATEFMSVLVLIAFLVAFLYYLVMSVIIYSRLTERINELAPRQYQRWGRPAVNKRYAVTAILAYWIPYLGIFISMLCWYMWWSAAQTTLNAIARGEDIEELTDVFA